ncbi:nickel ABC transporter substrate-binding protein [Alteribacillus bidgolensis]|uniref:Peptide/nickel transport system substrate-binding protein n=1 Tax=Alteribacillus bidgolensis TaxID=930129 RepID=A0A1G8FYK9_9BACI|nr:nickel ABC transporter substrate-binding protein [Alteribacillus bidgolensis]SDH87213.1 peptide/nickel transport system substrate-binding protein [Alteribacillus bidgolensis]
MKRFALFVIGAASLFSGCEAPGTDVNNEGQTKSITYAFHYPSEVLNPAVDVNYTSVRMGLAETLAHTKNEEVEPWLAESWEQLDENTWAFTIQEGITFHDGSQLDAKAVKTSLEETMAESGAMDEALGIEEMKANGQELTIETKENSASFPSKLVHPNTAIWKPSDDKNEVIGTGPFEMNDFKPNQQLNLQRYDGYWDGASELDEVSVLFNEDANSRLAALKSGDADIVYRPPVEDVNTLEEEYQVDTVSSLRTHQLIYQMENPVLQDINVRKALDKLIDRKEVIEAMNQEAVPAKGPFHEDFDFSVEREDDTSDIEEAVDLLEESGYSIKDGVAVKDGEPLELTLVTYSARPELPLIAQLLQERAKQAGVTIDIQLIEQIDDYLTNNTSWDLSIYSFVTAPQGDASYLLNTAYAPDGGLNVGNVEDDTLTEKIDAFNKESTEEKQNQLAQEATSMILDEYYHSFIVHPTNSVAMRQDITGWKTSTSEYYMITNEIGIEE